VARIRYIKPGFFTNEELGHLKPLARLLFIGLWCLADCEGRVEDRPERIKVELLPFERGNPVNGLLAALADASLIHRYEVEGRPYIQVINFKKHQHPHPKEAPSQIPAPTFSGPVNEKPRNSKTNRVGNGEWGDGGMGNGIATPATARARDPANIFALFEELTGRPVPTVILAEEMEEAANEHTADCIAYAFREAAANEACTWSYVKAILAGHAAGQCGAARKRPQRRDAKDRQGFARKGARSTGIPITGPDIEAGKRFLAGKV